MEILNDILKVCALFSPFFWYFLGHTHGHRWTKKNPGKDHIEYFFEVEKEEPAK